MVTENDPRQIRYRLMAHNMTISGIAVIVFSIWNIIRTGLYFKLHNVDLIRLFEKNIPEQIADLDPNIYRFLNYSAFSVMLFFLVLEMLLRCYVGFAAITDAAAKKKKSIFYIVLALFIGISLISSVVTKLVGYFSDDLSEKMIRDMTTSAVIDFISGFAFFELAVSSLVARTHRKKLLAKGKMIHIPKEK